MFSCAAARGAPTSEEIDAPETTTQSWVIDGSNDNKVTFKSGSDDEENETKGSIGVSSTTGEARAASVSLAEGVTSGLLTMDFQCDSSITPSVTYPSEISKPVTTSVPETVSHIYAVSETTGNAFASATGISFPKGGSFAIFNTSATPAFGTYAAYYDGNKYDGQGSVCRPALARTIALEDGSRDEGQGSTLTFPVPVNLLSFAVSQGTRTQDSAAVVIGNGIGYGAGTVTTGYITANPNYTPLGRDGGIGIEDVTLNFIDDDNTLTANAHCVHSCAAVAIGSGIGSGDATRGVAGPREYTVESKNVTIDLPVRVGLANANITFNNDSKLTATANSTAHYATSVVVGSAIGSGDGSEITATTSGITANFGSGNTVIASSFSDRCATAVTFGSAIGSAYVGVGDKVSAELSNSTFSFGPNNTLCAFSSGQVVKPDHSFNGFTYSSTAIIGSAVDVVGEHAINNYQKGTRDSSAPYTGEEVAYAPSVARGIVANFDGSQTLAALAYSGDWDNDDATCNGLPNVNVFGADNTDKGSTEGDFGWRVGIYADGREKISMPPIDNPYYVSSDTTINILGANLHNRWTIDEGIATAKLCQNQDGARVFALGKDFQIYIGAMWDKTQNSGAGAFVPMEAKAGTANIVNVFGEISKAKKSETTSGVLADSMLIVDNGWTANAFGPVKDFETIAIGEMATSNVNLYNAASNIGKIEIFKGSLHVGRDTGGKFAAIDDVASKITYVDPPTGTRYVGATIGGKVAIDTSMYKWNGTTTNGNLTLGNNNLLVFHVDSSQNDPAFADTAFADQFALVKGFMTVDPLQFDDPARLIFNGGKIAIIDESSANTNGDLPTNKKYWIIRSTDTESTTSDSRSLFDFPGISGFESDDHIVEKPIVYGDRYKADDTVVKGAIVDTSIGNGVGNDLHIFISDENLNVVAGASGENVIYLDGDGKVVDADNAEAEAYTIEDDPVYLKPDGTVGSDGDGVSRPYMLGRGMYLSVDYVAPSVPPEKPEKPGVPPPGPNTPGLWTAIGPCVLTGVDIVRDACEEKMIIDGAQSGDPFLCVVGSYTDQGTVGDCGYTNRVGGLVAGLDYTHKLGDGGEKPNANAEKDKKDAKYVRAGLVFSYLRGRTNFSGAMAIMERTAKETMYVGSLFAAYQSFNDNSEKMDVNLFAGFERADVALHRINPMGEGFTGKVRANVIFAYGELIKNIWRRGSWQLGPWIFVKYNHVVQNEYTDWADNPPAVGQPEHGEKCTFDFLDTVFGLSLEYEKVERYADPELDKQFEDDNDRSSWRFFLKGGYGIQPVRRSSLDIDLMAAVLRYPPKYYWSVSAGFRRKFDGHWELDGTCNGVFGNKFSRYIASLGLAYTF